jgi:hypothetical protein
MLPYCVKSCVSHSVSIPMRIFATNHRHFRSLVPWFIFTRKSHNRFYLYA